MRLKNLFLFVCAAFARGLFSLRYRVTIQGLSEVKQRAKGRLGILILPNHTAHTDPLVLYAWLWPLFKMRPLIVESIGRLPVLRNLIPFVRPILIPDFESSLNQFKLRRAQLALAKVVEALKEGDNVLVYPSGKFKNQGKEIIGGASGAYEIVNECPEVSVLLVRVTGFWGSSFSKAMTGTSPDFFKASKEAVKTLFRNGLFFVPRRKITIELELQECPKHETRIAFNRYLENWYNRYPDEKGNISESEPLVLVPYQFWSKKVPDIVLKNRENRRRASSINPSLRAKIIGELRAILDSPTLEIKDEMDLSRDLGMDSLNIAELVGYLVQNYDVGELAPEDLDTVGTVLELAGGASLPKEKEVKASLPTWPEEKGRPDPIPPIGKTFPEAFLNICQALDGFVAMGDDLVGPLSFKKCRQSVLVLAQYFKTFPEEKIAVMLPSSAGAMLVILALQFANKIPVMLNWTLGPRYLESMMKISGAKQVLSSWRFIERINHVDFGALVDQTLFLEDIRLSLSLSMKLKGAFLSLCPNRFILQALKLDQVSEDRFAVILFSSGTETAPKGIPLSHKNVLAAIRSSLWNYRDVLTATDVVHGILPCFHSFGFSIAGFLGLLSGLRIAFYPNPTDSVAVAESAARWKVTYLPTVPGLLKRLFQVATKEQLEQVRFFITAGEKAPPELFKKVAQVYPRAQLTEGYGLSETSPTLTIMRPGIPPKGVGQLLPGVEAMAIHLETGKPLSQGEVGEICVKGANIFQGYLGGAPNPFVQIHGETWLKTGDMGYVDSDETIILTGRIKRFVKLGGEMVSLGAMEEALRLECAKRNLIPNDLPALAIVPLPHENGEVKLIFFSIFPIEKETVNQILRDAGFSNLVKVSSVQKMDEIPLLGTGKINYRRLQEVMLQD